MTDREGVVYDLSNGAIFSDFERPLSPISRSRHYLMLNISETVRDRGPGENYIYPDNVKYTLSYRIIVSYSHS